LGGTILSSDFVDRILVIVKVTIHESTRNITKHLVLWLLLSQDFAEKTRNWIVIRKLIRPTDPTDPYATRATLFHRLGLPCSLLLILSACSTVLSQTRAYPEKIRGYKVERAVVEVKKPSTSKGPKQSDGSTEPDANVDDLIQLGAPKLAKVTPLGITFATPLVVAPVTQGGHVDFLLFEDMVINEHSVSIDEYRRGFDLPSKQPLTLPESLRIYIYLSSAVLAVLDEWSDSKETWPVTGRIYACGKFKKSVFSFKRCIPVELNLTMRNPLKER
jgi:hypothetical protein